MDFIEYQVSNKVATITINRPEKRNALNPTLVKELTDSFTLANNDVYVRVILLKANGKAFSAGADLEYLQQLQQNSFEDNLQDSNNLRQLFESIYNSPKITIAQIEGHAIAGGCGLATITDYSFSIPDAQFGYTEVKIGFIPAIVMFFLLRKTSENIARKILLSGDLFTAIQAKEYGLITDVLDDSIIESHVEDFAFTLIESTSGTSIEYTKKMISNIQSMNMKDALDYAANQNAHLRATEDCKKGISAFLNKEIIKWN